MFEETSILTVNQELINIDISNWHTGANSLIFEFKDQIYVEQIIKQ